MTTPAAPVRGITMTARAAPNCTEIPAETTSATGPKRARARSGPPVADGERTPAAEDGAEEGAEGAAEEDGVIPPG